ncbi:hypothetical protein BDV95DRAFT_660638 [Massariosphaeria phaeospora]|uniref:SRR1-like domain-containing protein n=1 Tax=Massariosphaeria phaeospora TaxID=100035 RepID=A0A7C8I7Z0_9PLEO|nr:hypothetical protein BDV95DRAFT_660638 [Massariosphaeria phaeospora]
MPLASSGLCGTLLTTRHVSSILVSKHRIAPSTFRQHSSMYIPPGLMSSPVYIEFLRKRFNIPPETKTHIWKFDYDPILQAADTHGPIFSKARFDEAYAQYNKLKDHGGNYTMTDMWNKQHDDHAQPPFDIPGLLFGQHQGMRTKINMVFNHLQFLADQYPRHRYKSLTAKCPIGFLNEIPHKSAADCFDAETLNNAKPYWKTQWHQHPYHEALVSFLMSSYGEKTAQVDQIVCFGLGNFEDNVDARPRCYTQHLLACTIRDALAKLQWHKPAIYAQDPAYCPAGVRLLKQDFDIEVVDDPEGWRMLNSNTFVVSISPMVPVRQFAVDYTAEAGGPAGMLCNGIVYDGLNESWVEFVGHPPHDLEADPASPAVFEYAKERCVERNFRSMTVLPRVQCT